MQPVSFWQWYAVAIAAEFGLPRELDVARRLDETVEHINMERAS